MPYEYRLLVREQNGSCTDYTATELLAQCKALKLTRHVNAIEALKREGMRYSNQDCDVLGAAYRAIETWQPE